MELIRMNDTEDPLVGSNVTLICRISKYFSIHNSSAPEWSLKRISDNEIIRTINETNPPEGLIFSTYYFIVSSFTVHFLPLTIKVFK